MSKEQPPFAAFFFCLVQIFFFFFCLFLPFYSTASAADPTTRTSGGQRNENFGPAVIHRGEHASHGLLLRLCLHGIIRNRNMQH